MQSLKKAAKIPLLKNIITKRYSFNSSSLQRNIFGLNFKNPVGLGAGFDKNAIYLDELKMLGFSFVEIGTVTPLPQSGNEKPRLFRLPADKALINRMGFNNDGAEVIMRRLETWKEKNPESGLIVGGNIGKNKITSNEDAWKDYEICFQKLFNCVDYFVVNVSSPNTPGLRELQGKEALKKIISNLQNINRGKQNPKPMLLKISPDTSFKELSEIIELSFEVSLSGLVATNTTVERAKLQTSKNKIEVIGAGGLSGKPLQDRSSGIIRYLNKQINGRIPIIGSGGVFNGKDAREKLDAGASLIEVWTGFIYEGPSIVKNICKYLSRSAK